LIPFVTFNLAISLTSITLKNFILGTFGMTPGLALRVFIGATIASLTQETSILRSDMIILGVVVIGTTIAIAGLIIVSSLAKNYLNSLDIKNDGEAEDSYCGAVELNQLIVRRPNALT
jgi:uncharacterized membrane protein YdjX (TVP38/TMEM64 family)